MAIPHQELTLTFRLLINWFLLVFKILSYSGFLAWPWTCCFDWVTVFLSTISQAVANPCLAWNYLPSSFFFFFWSSFFFNLLPLSWIPLSLPPSLPSIFPISVPFFLCFHQHSIHSECIPLQLPNIPDSSNFWWLSVIWSLNCTWYHPCGFICEFKVIFL